MKTLEINTVPIQFAQKLRQGFHVHLSFSTIIAYCTLHARELLHVFIIPVPLSLSKNCYHKLIMINDSMINCNLASPHR